MKNKTRRYLAMLLALVFTLISQCAFAVTPDHAPKGDAPLTLQDTLYAYYLYPSLEEAKIMHQETKGVPIFAVTEQMVTQLFALQGIDVRLPTELPDGYKRGSFSLRKSRYGILTEAELAFLDYYKQTVPSIKVNDDQSVTYGYDIPVSYLTDITYVGVRYDHEESGNYIVLIIQLYAPSQFPYSILFHEEDWQKVDGTPTVDGSAYYFRERLSDETSFLVALSAPSFEAIRDRVADEARPVVMYEASSLTVGVDELMVFIRSAVFGQ